MKTPQSQPAANPERNLPLPGMAAISLWMLALAVVGVTGVLTGHYRTTGPKISVLLLSTLFAVAALGLMRRRRWGWALTLGAIVLSLTLAIYSLIQLHQVQWVVMSLANLVFFLYLVRPQVTERLK
jgi:branched-subunit amino acid ABC-type transport system permease component